MRRTANILVLRVSFSAKQVSSAFGLSQATAWRKRNDAMDSMNVRTGLMKKIALQRIHVTVSSFNVKMEQMLRMEMSASENLMYATSLLIVLMVAMRRTALILVKRTRTCSSVRQEQLVRHHIEGFVFQDMNSVMENLSVKIHPMKRTVQKPPALLDTSSVWTVSI
jgi:hypothetical protein